MTATFKFVFGLMIVYILTILPLPLFLQPFRPLWVLSYFFYLRQYFPIFFNFYFIFLAGLLLDLLFVTVLGLHSMAMLIAFLVVWERKERFDRLPRYQQLCWVAVLCVVYQVVLFGMQTLLGYPIEYIAIVTRTVCTSLLWIWFKICLDDIFLATSRC